MQRWLQNVKYEMSLDTMQLVRHCSATTAGCNDKPAHEGGMIKMSK